MTPGAPRASTPLTRAPLYRNSKRMQRWHTCLSANVVHTVVARGEGRCLGTLAILVPVIVAARPSCQVQQMLSSKALIIVVAPRPLHSHSVGTPATFLRGSTHRGVMVLQTMSDLWMWARQRQLAAGELAKKGRDGQVTRRLHSPPVATQDGTRCWKFLSSDVRPVAGSKAGEFGATRSFDSGLSTVDD